ncbi:XrtA/PEP-CTERM system exopolysaccharide export protein [Teredinibacter waterburyi]|uniref:XrtA/PEP-CTERM system exopolysaccharide export protein n=1 Tax=Teredinibacter waterburyi TaxID=1500538 RepID=UPI00165FEC72|nr:XrtA/PEP-CTERM system exopolysaccharide export protein [Teredinibacter waterburyi]
MNKVRLIYLLLAAVILLVAGCGSQPIARLDDSGIDYASIAPYKIGVADSLSIVVWRNEELSVNVPVRPDGKISIPLIGDIIAAGKNVPQLALEIEKALDSYVRSPKVTVIVTAATNAEYLHRVRVTGAVNSPISVPYSEGMTVLDLVLQAGGVSEFSSPNSTKLYRKGPKGMKVYPVYLNDIMRKGDLRSNYDLRPSDVITVPESIF